MTENFIQNRFGYCYYEIKKSIALIYNLYVYPEHRQKGMAKILLRHVIYEIRERGYTGEITIQIAPKEKSVIKEKLSLFYKKYGLTIV